VKPAAIPPVKPATTPAVKPAATPPPAAVATRATDPNSSVKAKAFIPLHATVPRLTVSEVLELKGLLKLDSESTRQLNVNSFADVSASPSGASIFGGNMHVLKNEKADEFRYSNNHAQMGAMGFAANFPHYHKASIVAGVKQAVKDQSFQPKTVVTFTAEGNVGVGVDGPASKLHIQTKDPVRQINANHWLDASACASGIGLVAGNSYVSTAGDKVQFRYANSHSAIGAIGLAFNYPAWGKASVISSSTSKATAKEEFKPTVIQTYTQDGRVGIGTEKPSARLTIASPGRQLSLKDWLDVSSQGNVGFMGMNAHLVMQGSAEEFHFSNTEKDVGSLGMATNYPVANQLSIIASPSSQSTKDAMFKPQVITTFTRDGSVGVGTHKPSSQLDVQHKTKRQISANRFADVSANDDSQAFFAGNGFTVGTEFAYSNSNLGAVGLATNYPSGTGSASIISSGTGKTGEAGESFKPVKLAEFKSDGSLEVTKDLVIKGDLHVTGRMLSDDTSQYDFLEAHEALVNEHMELQERMQKMEQTLVSMMEASAR